MRTLIFLLAFGFAANVYNVKAQTTPLKIGFADVDYIFSEMPESKQVEKELQSVQNVLKTQIDNKSAEFRKKLEDYQANMNTMLPAVRSNTERELQQLQQNLQKLQEDAQTTIQQKQSQLMEPVYKKVSGAIEAVSKENGFSMILSGQLGGLDVVLYGDDKLDVSNLVLKNMGITPKPQEAETTPQTAPQK
jgi:outer membrane protein